MRISTVEAAKFLGLAPQTLRVWRCNGNGPSYYKLNKRVVYDRDELEVWLKSRHVANTAEAARIGGNR